MPMNRRRVWRNGLGLDCTPTFVRPSTLYTMPPAGSSRLSTICQIAGIEVLSGLPNPRDWFELRSGEVVEVLAELARNHPYVVANVGPRIEDLPESGGPARFAVTRATLSLADLVILVGSTTPVGVTRVVDWLADGRSLITGKPLAHCPEPAPR